MTIYIIQATTYIKGENHIDVENCYAVTDEDKAKTDVNMLNEKYGIDNEIYRINYRYQELGMVE